MPETTWNGHQAVPLVMICIPDVLNNVLKTISGVSVVVIILTSSNPFEISTLSITMKTLIKVSHKT